MKTDNITEIVIYSLKPETKPETAVAFIREILSAYEGVLSVETMQTQNDPLTFMDRVLWENQAKAEHAQKTIEQHPKFQEFASLFAETKFFAHFKPFELNL